MDYHFSHTEFQQPSARANELLEEAGLPTMDPAIFLLKNSAQGAQLLRMLPDSLNILTLEKLLPNRQQDKLRILDHIRNQLTPSILRSLKGADSANAALLMENWDLELLAAEDLPEGYQKKFRPRGDGAGELAFIFPGFDIDNGLLCRAFARQVGEVRLPGGVSLHSTGTPLLRAALLDRTLPQMWQSLALGFALALLWLSLFAGGVGRALLLFASPLLGAVWLRSLLCLLSIEVNVYNIFAFVLLAALVFDGPLHLARAHDPRRATGTLILSCLVPLISFAALLFSSHPGLHSIGVVAVLGVLCMMGAHLAVFSLVREKNFIKFPSL
jgi:uncharacterized membrane protein YhaH (DUF805 family)